MKYHIVSASSSDGLEKLVNALMSEGWQPIGGVSACQLGEVTVIMQAMVME